jgi:hypothetical protein
MFVHLRESPYVVTSEQVSSFHEMCCESHMGKRSTLIVLILYCQYTVCQQCKLVKCEQS